MFCHTLSIILAFLSVASTASSQLSLSPSASSTGSSTETETGSSSSPVISPSATGSFSPSSSSTSSTSDVCVPDPDYAAAGFDTCCAECPTCDGNFRHLRGLPQRKLPKYCPMDDDDDITSHDMWCGTEAWSNHESFKYYFCGKGEPVTLEEVGLVDSVTEYWKNEMEETIKNDICATMRAGDTPDLASTDWDVSRPWPWSCHFWIGGFTMHLTGFQRRSGTCDVSIDLSMVDDFDEPLNWKWNCPFPWNIPGSTVFSVSHTWTLEFTCPEPCDPTPAPTPPCGGKGERCCGNDQCDGNLKCMGDVCTVFDCIPGDCKCEIGNPDLHLGCWSDATWRILDVCEGQICYSSGHLNCGCENPNNLDYDQNLFP